MPMQISYNRLWKLLIDKEMKKSALREKTGMSSSTMAKLSKNQEVTMAVLMRICETLDCNIEDIVEFKKDKEKENV